MCIVSSVIIIRVDRRNYSGLSPFNCVPFTGLLQPGQYVSMALSSSLYFIIILSLESNMDVMVEFSPDHPGRLFTDLLQVEINSQVMS